MDRRFTVLANFLVPGSGLITLRRAWLGFAIAVLFGVLAQIVVFGMLIVPRDVPRWASWGSLFAAVAVWVFAQRLAWIRYRQVTSPERAGELAGLCGRAAEALGQGDSAEARRALLVALDLDDENVEVLSLWGSYLEGVGQSRVARRFWKRVLSLERDGPHALEARAALGRL